MRERPRCSACDGRLGIDAQPCPDCPGYYCDGHTGSTRHPCGDLYYPWRAWVETEPKLVEYYSTTRPRPPVEIVRPGPDGITVRLYPGPRLPTQAAGLRMLLLVSALALKADHPQRAVDLAALVFTWPPLGARHAVVTLSGLLGVQGAAGTMPEPPMGLE